MKSGILSFEDIDNFAHEFIQKRKYSNKKSKEGSCCLKNVKDKKLNLSIAPRKNIFHISNKSSKIESPLIRKATDCQVTPRVIKVKLKSAYNFKNKISQASLSTSPNSIEMFRIRKLSSPGTLELKHFDFKDQPKKSLPVTSLEKLPLQENCVGEEFKFTLKQLEKGEGEIEYEFDTSSCCSINEICLIKSELNDDIDARGSKKDKDSDSKKFKCKKKKYLKDTEDLRYVRFYF